MANEVKNVTTAKPKVSGAVFYAPLGTTLPTDATTPLDTKFKNLGYVSEDGFTFSTATSSENIKEFFKRVYNFLDELKTKDYKSVLIVAHSGVSKAFNGYFNGIQDGKFLNRGLKNCEIKEYEL